MTHLPFFPRGFIEPFESRIAPASVSITFLDGDGDRERHSAQHSRFERVDCSHCSNLDT
jgi:hypothetical protein